MFGGGSCGRLPCLKVTLRICRVGNDGSSVAAGSAGTGKDERDDALADAENKAQERLNESTRLREQVVKLEQEAMQLKQQVESNYLFCCRDR